VYHPRRMERDKHSSPESPRSGRSQTLRWIAIVSALVVLSLLFWKLRVLGAADQPRPNFGSFDIYLEHYPMAKYGFGVLRDGRLPLWNPYQLFGQPFLAMYYVGVLYPLNAVYLVLDTALATEVSFLIHMMIGALGLVALVRHAGLSFVAALTGALSFVWSGMLIYAYVNQASLFGSMCWIPVILFLVDRVFVGARRAWLWLMLGVGARILLGGIEIFLHTLSAVGVLLLLRLLERTKEGAFPVALRSLGLVAVGIGAGILLASPQLLASIELTGLSSRGVSRLSFEQTSFGRVPVWELLRAAPAMAGVAGVGVLPLLGLPLALGGRGRSLGIFGIALVVFALLLASGGLLYRVYYELPFVGGMFRRPSKFMDLYSVGAALVTAGVVQRLFDWRGLPRSRLWRRSAWLASLVIAGGFAVWPSLRGTPPVELLVGLSLLLVYGVCSRRRTRLAVAIALCGLQAAACFFSAQNRTLRPYQQPEVFTNGTQELFAALASTSAEGRVYVSSAFSLNPALTPKQGMLNEIPFAVDYTPLLPMRTAKFFEAVTGSPFPLDRPFDGRYTLAADSRWDLLDLTGTRFYAVARGEPVRAFMDRQGEDFQRTSPLERVAVYERSRSFPRAYFVPSAHVVASGDEALATLVRGSLDLWSTVVLEVPPGAPPPPPSSGSPSAAASTTTLVRDEPERVDVQVLAPVPGFLVLADTFYPGWSAHTSGQRLPVYRANYLFRAVHLEPGLHRVTFEYEPRSVRWGLVVSGVTAAVALGVVVRPGRRSLPA
jgi:hypothetical protein